MPIAFPEELSEAKRAFVVDFYKASDRPGSPEAYRAYADFFTSDGVCIFSGTKFSGDLVKMREGMWEKIAKRDHRPERVYRLSDSDLVIYGDATLTTKQGAAIETIFFARMLFDGDKLKFYEVAKRDG